MQRQHNAKRHEHAGQCEEKRAWAAPDADDRSGDGADQEKRDIGETGKDAEGGAAIVHRHAPDGFNAEGGEDQRKAEARECRAAGSHPRRGPGPHQQYAKRFDGEADDADRESTVAVDGLDEKEARRDERHAKGGEAERRAVRVPVAAEVVEGDESGQDAVADAAEGQRHAVRSDSAQHIAKGKMLAGSDGRWAFALGEEKTDGAEQGGQKPERSQSPVLIEDDAQRGAEGQAAIGGHAVIGDDFGSVLGSGTGDAPERRSGRAEALADAEREAAGNEGHESKRRVEAQRHSGQQEETAERGSCHAPENGYASSRVVRDAAGPGTAEKCGDVLDADDQAGEGGVETQLQMDKGGQDGQRQADREIADEGEVNVAENGPDRAAGGG